MNVHPGCGAAAITMPMPESRSTPGASMSSAVANSALLSCVCVNPGFADLISAMIAAAFGAAADVPKNCPGKSPAPVTNTPSRRGEIGLLQHRAARRREVAGRDGGAVAQEKDPARAVRAERLDDVGRAERIRMREAGVRGGHAERKDVARRAVSVRLAGGRDRQLPAVGVQVQKARSGRGLLHDHDARARGAVAHLLVRVVVAVLDVRRARGD